MPGATRRNKKNGGGWSQGPALSAEQYYLTEYKRYNECYPMSRPGSIQSNPNPNLAQTGMAGGKKSRRTKRNTRRNRKVGGSSCSEYFATRGGKRSTKRGGCGCLLSGGGSCPFMRGGSPIYGECPYKANSFNCPYVQGGAKRNERKQKKNKTRKNLKGGRYGIDPGVSVGGDGPNVAALTAHVPCEAYRPSPINPHHPNELVSAPETGIHFAGLSPGAVLKGGARRKNKKSKNVRSSLKGGEVNLVHTKFAAYTGAPISEKAPNMPTDMPHSYVAPQLQTADAQMYSGAPLTGKYPQPSLNGPKYNCSAPTASNQVVYTGNQPLDKYPQFVASQQPMTSHQLISQGTAAPPSGIHVSHNPLIKPGFVQAGGQLRGDEHPLAYTAPTAGFAFVPNISQGQTLNPGQIPYQVVVPVDGSDSASCGLTCGQAIAQINKA
jgi:hypothetical protein